jgi:hypothetical protein
VRHLCLVIQSRVFFRNDSLSRLRCSGLASAYGWVTIMILYMVKQEHPLYSNRLWAHPPSFSLTTGREHIHKDTKLVEELPLGFLVGPVTKALPLGLLAGAIAKTLTLSLRKLK